MVGMAPALHVAAVKFSRRAKVSLARLIAEVLAERIEFRRR
jgi:predicted HicB family RNase H-like nuclease